MAFDYDTLLINPPNLRIKPDYLTLGTPGKLRVDCINPGLLSIASYLESLGHQVSVLDMSSDENLDRLKKEFKKGTPRLAGVSSTSAYDYLDSLAIMDIIKQVSPKTICLTGGQQTSSLGEVVFEENKSVDIVSNYEGELTTEKILSQLKTGGNLKNVPGIFYKKNGKIIKNEDSLERVDLNQLPPLNFDLYPDYKKFTPFVEESRGCSFGCHYCSNVASWNSIARIKNADRFLKELENTVSFYGHDPIYAFLASTFGLNAKNTKNLTENLKKYDLRWTTEFRVDTPWHMYLEDMYKSGFIIANVGVESASPEILLRMGKTKDPEKYVKRAEELVKAKTQLEDLSLRVNMMTYIGESPKTIKENYDFLLRSSYGIDMVLGTTLFVVHGSPLEKEFDQFEKTFGSQLVKTDYSVKTHLYPCKVSKYFSFEETAYYCQTLEKIFSKTEEDYQRHRTANYMKYDSINKEPLKG